jgi:hypothetical protein
MRLRAVHVLHSGVVLAVLVLLGFASAFLVDALQANSTYDALAAHRVAVRGHVIGCFDVQAGIVAGYGARGCRVGYSYKDRSFSAMIGDNQSRTFYVDPLDTAYRMNSATFSNGPVEVTGDIVIAVALFAGAALITTVHQIHLYRRRKRRGTDLQNPRSSSGHSKNDR